METPPLDISDDEINKLRMSAGVVKGMLKIRDGVRPYRVPGG